MKSYPLLSTKTKYLPVILIFITLFVGGCGSDNFSRIPTSPVPISENETGATQPIPTEIEEQILESPTPGDVEQPPIQTTPENIQYQIIAAVFRVRCTDLRHNTRRHNRGGVKQGETVVTNNHISASVSTSIDEVSTAAA